MGITLVGIMAGAFGGKNYMERFEKWLTRIQDENLMVVGAMTDPKGDRSKPLQINRIQINMFISLRVKMTALLFLVRNFTWPERSIRKKIGRLIEAMTGSTALVESMHGAGSPQSQRIMIFREGKLNENMKLAKALAGIPSNGDG